MFYILFWKKYFCGIPSTATIFQTYFLSDGVTKFDYVRLCEVRFFRWFKFEAQCPLFSQIWEIFQESPLFQFVFTVTGHGRVVTMFIFDLTYCSIVTLTRASAFDRRTSAALYIILTVDGTEKKGKDKES